MAQFGIPLGLLTDSYKTTHYKLYPEAQKMVAYGEFRGGYDKDIEDTRIVFYGMRYIIDNYIAKQYTVQDVEEASKFFETHNSGGTQFPFPKDLFLKFVKEHNGYFPVKIQALAEGSVVYPHVPVYQITAEGEYARLVTYLETLLTMVWYPSTVATLSRRCHQIIEQAYHRSVDESGMWSLDSRLHDFGFRGCTSVEQAIIGGCAHLLNFSGTDTLPAAYYAQFRLNNGKPVGYSIPATEHSIMTSHENEKKALTQLLSEFGQGVCACVMDSYDYTLALEKVLPSVAKLKTDKGGFLVLRPDSGDPVSVVLEALLAAEKIFGADLNQKGFKVLRGVGVIQGDGINIKTLADIAQAVEQNGFSAQNVAYGMGGGLLQKVNRDTMQFATKLNFIVYADGTKRDVMKMPKTATSKRSLPGVLSVTRELGFPMVVPHEQSSHHEELKVVYDHGRVCQWDDFDTVRNRVNRQWKHSPKVHNPISEALQSKIEAVVQQQQSENQKLYE
ncbi:nicotinate phosphoribosyltransferase family-domain-containing protein [Gorgonomyces haynaldii]|nr:nicotinate phosphoribosyltransferase family-domain-containing protein [Gorgonomyces haynaldii]